MGTIEEKFNYSFEAKDLIKQGINNLGGNITSQTELKEYADELQNIYDVLPKTEYQEGTEVTLSNTLKGKLDFENGVVGIGQSSQDTTNGYQLFDISKAPSSASQYIYNNGFKLTKGVNRTLIIYLPNTIPAGTYTISADIINSTLSDNNKVMINFRDENVQTVLGNWEFLVNGTFTLTAPVKSLYFFIASSEADGVTITLDDIMLETGTTAHDWEQYTGGQASPNPSYEQEIKCVAGKNKISLLNCSEFGSGASPSNKTSNSVTLTGTGTWSNCAYILENTQKNGYFTISAKYISALARTTGISVYGSNELNTSNLTSISSDTSNLSANTEKKYSVTYNSGNYKYICFRFWTNYSATALEESVALNITEIQLEEGTQATSYLPYNTIEEVVGGKNECESFVGVDTDVAYRGVLRCEFDIKPDTQYAISFKGTNGCKLYTNETLFTNSQYFTIGTSRITLVATTKSTIQSDQHTTDGWLILKNQADTPSGCTFSEVQIEKNSQVTSYEPYVTPKTYQFSLGDIKPCGIGNYKDELIYDVDEDKVYKNEKIGNVTFTGEEGWTQTGARQDTFYLPHDFFAHYLYPFQYLYSNIAKFNKYINATSEIDEIGSYIYVNGSAGFVYFQFPNITTLTEFKNIIQNSLAIYIQEPVLTEITDTTLISQVKALYNAHSNNGTTIITSNGDLPMIIKCRALKST